MRGQQADLLHESRGIPIIRLTANLSGLQLEDARAAHRRKALASGRQHREAAGVGAGHDPLESRPVARGKLVDHAIGEVRDCGKGAVYLTSATSPPPLRTGV